MAKNTKIKQAVLETGFDKEVADASYQNFRGDYSKLNELIGDYGEDVVRVALALNNAKYKRKQRLQKRVGQYIPLGHCQFFTFTFRDEILEKTSSSTRRAYVRRWLKENCLHYVANIDFGGKGEREHYHAIAFCGKCDYSSWIKRYGYLKAERIRTSQDDVERTCKYVAKLTNHALKETARMTHMIYSRQTQEEKRKKREYLEEAF